MFQTLHPATEVSCMEQGYHYWPYLYDDSCYCDAPVNHNFELLKKLLLPDRSISRPQCRILDRLTWTVCTLIQPLTELGQCLQMRTILLSNYIIVLLSDKVMMIDDN